MRVGDVRDDGEAEPGAGQRAGGRRSVEAVEDVRQVGVVDARAVVGDRDPTGLDEDRHRRPVGTELHGVVDQVRQRPIEHRRLADQRHRRPGDFDATVVAAPGPVGHRLGDLDQVALLGRLGACRVGAEVDDLGHQRGQLAQLGRHGVEDAPTIRRGEVAALQELDAGSQRGQRGTQLVSGVGDQLSLLAAGPIERAEHRRQTRREPTDLVGAAGGERRVELLGSGDPFGAVGELLDGSGDAPGSEPAQSRSRSDADRDQRNEPIADPGEGVIGLGQAPCDLHHRIVGERSRHHAVCAAVELDVAVQRLAGAADLVDDVDVDRERIGPVERRRAPDRSGR